MNTVTRIAPTGAQTAATTDPSAIALGGNEYGAAVTLALTKLLEGRLLIQGVSGAGKSWTLRRLLECSATRIQQVVIDPEGEFRTLAELCGHLHVDAASLDADSMVMLGERARDRRVSLVVDVSNLTRSDRMIRVAAFLRALLDAPERQWSACLVAIDETQLLAPYGVTDEVAPDVRKGSIAAIADLMGRGRKRGLVGVLATRRLAQLAKSAAAEVHNVLIGINTLDLDIKRAAEAIGWPVRKAQDRLPLLKSGQFVAVGPAFSQSPAVVTIGPVKSRHTGSTPALAPPRAGQDARVQMDIDRLIADSAAGVRMEESRLAAGPRAVRQFAREPAFAAAGALYEILKPIHPDGATLASLPAATKRPADAVAAAVALLQRHGIVELTDLGGVAAVRIDPEFAKWRL